MGAYLTLATTNGRYSRRIAALTSVSERRLWAVSRPGHKGGGQTFAAMPRSLAPSEPQFICRWFLGTLPRNGSLFLIPRGLADALPHAGFLRQCRLLLHFILLHRIPSINDDHLAGEVTRFFTGQKHRDMANFLRRAGATDGGMMSSDNLGLRA